jgi:hypothetical protein
VPLNDLGGWPGLLTRLCDGEDLTADSCESVLAEILSGEADPAQIAGFLIALKIKGETAEETTGLVRAMVAAAEPLDLPDDTIDIVGTGGAAARREGTSTCRPWRASWRRAPERPCVSTETAVPPPPLVHSTCSRRWGSTLT